MKRAESGEKKATRQCWECLKRRLVCDHTLPRCKKCIKAGKECPGYDEQKPLQWVEPGKVTSRRRKKDSPPKVYAIRARDHERIPPIKASLPVLVSEGPSESHSTEIITQDIAPTLDLASLDVATHYDAEKPQVSPEVVELYESQLAAMLVHEEKAAWWYSMTAEEQTEHISMMAAEAAAGVGVGQQIMRIGSQKDIRAVVERGQAWEAAMLLQSDKDPLEKLKRLLWIMEMNQLPSYEHLSNETSEVVQAVNYCRSVFPALTTLTDFTSQHQDLPGRQRNGLSGIKSSSDPLSNLGITCFTSCHAPHPYLPGSDSLHPFAPRGLESCAGSRQSIEDLQVPRPSDSCTQRECSKGDYP